MLDGLRGEDSIAELCRREGIAQSLYYTWSKEFLEAGKKRLAGDTARAATSDEVKQLRRESHDLKEVVAEQRSNYFAGMGWDDHGIPTKETLDKLNLSAVKGVLPKILP